MNYYLLNPWPWYLSGPMIGLIMLSMLYFGKTFGFSSNFRTMCCMLGAGKHCDFFDFDYKNQNWNLFFLVGSILGGVIGSKFFMDGQRVLISESTTELLKSYGVENPGSDFLPYQLFSLEALQLPLVWIILLLGGFLVGFGTRYAGGCTSGHAITGLSNLQLPSLLAVIGFFIGGLFMTYFILPYLLPLITASS